MNLDPTQPEPKDDTTTAATSPDLVDAIALEAVTTLAEPQPDEHAVPSDGEADPMVGRRLGAFRLGARIGGDEMVSVYRAERVGSVERPVAIKLIERGMDGAAIVRRFRGAIPVQAALSRHPNIAGLLEVGTTEDGRGYLVMGSVDGRRIDVDCDDRRLDVPARLRLFGLVCDAVQFTHQYGIIHRDIKPDNILVADDGVPRLIVSGIAERISRGDGGAGGLDGPDTADGLSPTGELVLTPEYASPEQVQGEPATTAGDVYAMGVVLYQLLTGRGPYRLKSRATSEVFQAVCEQAPERPSLAVVRRAGRRRARPAVPATPSSEPTTTATPITTPPEPVPEEVAAARGTTPAGLKRALTGDVDAIVLMAMRKEPERRYASAAELADDLRRHLDGRPVRARSDSAVYRASRFLRRYRTAVAAAIVVVLAVVAGIVGTTWGLLRARRDRDRAEASSRQARRAVDQFFTRVGDERLLNQPGLNPLRKELLQDAGRFYEEVLAERAADPSSGARYERAAARSRLARISAEVGSAAEAADQYQQAIALWEDLLRSHPDEPEYQEELARSLSGRGTALMRLTGRRDEALDACRRARALLEEALAGDPASASRRLLLGQVLQNTAQIQLDQGHPHEASETLQRVIEIEGPLAAEDPRWLDPQLDAARAHALLGQIQLDQPDGTGPALASYQQAVEILEAITREHPGLADEAHLLAADLGNLGVAQRAAGKLDSALKSSRRSIEILERLDRQYPGVLAYREGLAQAYNLMSDLHRRRSEPAASLAFAEKARPLLERLIAEHADDDGARIDLSHTYNNIARVRQQSAESAEALRSFQRAIDLLEALPDLDARNSYNLACNLALCLPLIGAKEGTQGVDDPEALPPGEKVRREVYGDRAIEVLRRAARGGLVNSDVLLSDPDLAAIRGRADFQQLVKEVDKQAGGSKS
jgi:non-specific serine/threonine protein kinase/serine/threonine-protein kinase